MLLYDADSDTLVWHEPGESEPPDASFGQWFDVTEEVWAVERAIDNNLGMPEAERHLAYLREMTDEGRPDENPDHSYWGGL